ncbi:hypothetical protein NW754_015900 [Fusarium falciforme]|nr:hypothetical protein NW754_015900 [Fusarium falciforme]
MPDRSVFPDHRGIWEAQSKAKMEGKAAFREEDFALRVVADCPVLPEPLSPCVHGQVLAQS